MKMPRLFALLAVCVFASAFSGCATGKKPGAGSANDGDYVNGTPLPERQEGINFMSPNVDRSRFHPVYFAFDSFAIGGGERGKIDEVAAFMRGASNTGQFGNNWNVRGKYSGRLSVACNVSAKPTASSIIQSGEDR